MTSFHIEDLHALFRSPNGVRDVDLKPVLTRLCSEVRSRFARASPASYEFFISTVRSINSIPGISHADLRVRCLFDSGMYFFCSGRAGAAIETAQILLSFADRTRDKGCLRRANTFAGIASAESGNVAQAVAHYARALQLARELDDFEGLVACFVNLGNALNYGSLHSDAINCFEQAAQIVEDHPDLRHRAPAIYCNLSQSLLSSGHQSRSLDAIKRSLDLSRPPKDALEAFSLAAREFTYVQVVLEAGDLGTARQRSANCGKYAELSNSPRARVMAAIASGLCDVFGGDVDRGLTQLESALKCSGDFYIDRLDALTSLIKVNDELGRPEQALVYLNEMLDFVRARRQEGISALLGFSRAIADDIGDLRRLETREAKLRARVAERDVVASRIDMLERFAVTADLKEEQSGEHGYRVGTLAGLMAHELGWPKDQCYAIELVARLHDIGKIALPDRILRASEQLRDAERQLMMSHTTIGGELLGKSNLPALQLAETVAKHHHEWWDGSGYPSKLKGKHIPIHARIVALADVFDALTHGRPYAHPWPIDKALKEISSRRGTQFDPELTDCFLNFVERLRNEHEDLDAYLGKAGRNSPFFQARNNIRLMLAEERENERKETVAGNETRH